MGFFSEVSLVLDQFPAGSCTASTVSSKDGSDGTFYCINGGNVGGTAGLCTCTSCNAGYEGASCQTASTCTALADSTKDGYIIEYFFSILIKPSKVVYNNVELFVLCVVPTGHTKAWSDSSGYDCAT